MLIKYGFIFLLSIFLSPCFAAITSIPNSNTKNLKSAELAEVQIQDVEAYQKENKRNENGERILRRKIAPTDLSPAVNVTNKNENSTMAIKIATEGSGVTKLSVVKDASKNVNKAETVIVTESPMASAIKNDMSSTASPTNLNVRKSGISLNGTASSREAIIKVTTSAQAAKNTTSTLLKQVTTTKLTNSSTTPATKSTTTKTTTTSTTTTSTTPKPKKPRITYSVEDMPEIANVIPEHSSSNQFSTESKSALPKLTVDEPDQPIAQPSQEISGGHFRNHRDYIIPFVSIIFAVPIVMGMVIVAYRRFRDFWSTRHYRRMDFLVDGMYND